MIFVCPKLAIDFRSLSASTGSVNFVGAVFACTDVAGIDVAGIDVAGIDVAGIDIAGFTFGVNRLWSELWKGSGGKRTPFPNV